MTIGFPERRDDGTYLVFERSYRAPIRDVWDCCTDQVRLNRWFGTWTGDPTAGRITLHWTHEDDAPDEDYVLERCDPPRQLRLHNDNPDPTQVWTLQLDLTEDLGLTTLRFAQLVEPQVNVADVGPGWQYWLDRLDAAVADRDPDTVTWGEQYTGLGEQYARTFAAGPA